ncbi:MAG: hypothetical protein WC141_07645 [Arcobacteraceae bacterium]
MINKINKYAYWLILTFLIFIICIAYNQDYSVQTVFLTFMLSLGVCTFLNIIFDAIFRFQVPYYFHYDQDIFYETQWNWDWNIKKEILHLKPTCPTCKSEVFHQFDTLLHKTEFVCETCNKQIANVNSSHRNFVLESVKNSIVRKLKKQDSSF